MKSCLNCTEGIWVLSMLNNVIPWFKICTSTVSSQCHHCLLNLCLNLLWVIEDSLIVRHINDFEVSPRTVHYISKIGFNLGSTRQYFEVISISYQHILTSYLFKL